MYQSYGYVDELKNQYDDPVEHFRQVVAKLNENEVAIKHVRGEIKEMQQPRVTPKVELKNIGYIIPLSFYQELGIDTFWRRVQKKHQLLFDLNAVFRMFVMLRALEPTTTSENIYKPDLFFESNDFNNDDIFCALELFSQYDRKFIAFLQSRLKKLADKNKTYVSSHRFYNTFNLQLSINQNTAEVERHQGAMREDCRQTTSCAVLSDGNGIPIDYSFGDMNANSQDGYGAYELASSLIDGIDDMLGREPDKTAAETKEANGPGDAERLDDADIIATADLYLNPEYEMRQDALRGADYLISVSPTKLNDDLRAWASDNDWDISLGVNKIKSTIVNQDSNGNENDVKLICFWNMYNCEQHRILKQNFARYVSTGNPPLGGGRGAMSAMHMTHLTSENEICDGLRILECSDTDIPSILALSAYMRLLHMNASFGHIKPLLYDIPTNFSYNDFLKSHFLICYTAEVLIALLSNACGNKYSEDTICNEMAQMMCLNTDENHWQITHWSDCIDDICESCDIHFESEKMSLTHIKQKIAQLRSK
jgi:hypothetical protein